MDQMSTDHTLPAMFNFRMHELPCRQGTHEQFNNFFRSLVSNWEWNYVGMQVLKFEFRHEKANEQSNALRDIHDKEQTPPT